MDWEEDSWPLVQLRDGGHTTPAAGVSIQLCEVPLPTLKWEKGIFGGYIGIVLRIDDEDKEEEEKDRRGYIFVSLFSLPCILLLLYAKHHVDILPILSVSLELLITLLGWQYDLRNINKQTRGQPGFWGAGKRVRTSQCLSKWLCALIPLLLFNCWINFILKSYHALCKLILFGFKHPGSPEQKWFCRKLKASFLGSLSSLRAGLCGVRWPWCFGLKKGDLRHTTTTLRLS